MSAEAGAQTPRVCIACDSPGPHEPIFERWGYQMVRCRNCGLVFQDPQPTFAELMGGGYYNEEEFAAALMGDLREETLRSARDKLAHLRRGGAFPAGGKVLDVGASSGAWVEVAGEAGATATGIEPGAHASAGARSRGLDVRTGTLADIAPDLGEERFDLITFWDVLEHLADPRDELRLAAGLLAPGGRIAATFPNVEGLYPRLTYRLLARRTGIWEYPELPVHLFDFAPRTATAVFARAGLSVDRIATYATPYAFYRSTTLSDQRTGGPISGRLVRAAFHTLRAVGYPLARLTDRGNAMFVQASLAVPGEGAILGH